MKNLHTQLSGSERALAFDDSFNGMTGSLHWSNLHLPSRLDAHNDMVPGSRHRCLFRKHLFLDEPHVVGPVRTIV